MIRYVCHVNFSLFPAREEAGIVWVIMSFAFDLGFFGLANDMLGYQVDLLLASPMKRALQTCLISFEPCVKRGMTVVAMPWAQEATDEASDTGSPIQVIRRDFDSEVNLDLLEDGWFRKEGANGTEPDVLMERAVRLRRWLKARTEHEIVLVTHGQFAHFLTGNVNDKGEQTTGWWKEAELRSFDFVDGRVGDPNDKAMIREAHESLKKRTSSLSIADSLAKFRG